jgi:hypothetical protein
MQASGFEPEVIDEVDDHSSSDDTRARGTGRVHIGAAQSARRAGTVNAAENGTT